MRDFLHNDGVPAIANGDWQTGEATAQHQRDLVRAFPGYYKQAPLAGVGLGAWLDSQKTKAWLEQQLKKALRQDGLPADVALQNEQEAP